MPSYFMEAPLFDQRALGMSMLLIAPTEHRFINKFGKESKAEMWIWIFVVSEIKILVQLSRMADHTTLRLHVFYTAT